MVNPMKLMKMKGLWEEFTRNHPKFVGFLDVVQKNSLKEGTIIEITVTTAEGKAISSNLKLTPSDMAMFKELSDLVK